LVIEAGADQDVVNYDLGRALNFPAPEMVEMFCAHGARASAGHLHQAAWRRRPPRTVAALLDAGAPIDAPDKHDLTALEISRLWGEDEVATLLRERGATASPVPDVSSALLDEMVILAVQGGHLETLRQLLDAGARIDGDPDSGEIPLGQACWRGRPAMVRELVERGAALRFGDGSAIGAALHGSRNCNHPEGGPTMGTIDEIPQEPYEEIISYLIDAGALIAG
jgi:ankyrin repeat protein